MDKDRVEGKVKDISGRVQRQVGEWTGDSESQVKGTAKQAEGKVQHAVGKAKDKMKENEEVEEGERVQQKDDENLDRKAS